ncbi:hypothetical protein DFP72DRAFT_1057198 [Ephemerocybe angulata]|uniref:F-box domain-containing protein n=1 Tax=Ephemerocybe angulata TaxID=980116 RepID=A0A8H6IK26_9AGAR|nr:hypothetical protein DFP72DRAFT_1057198 [Tulosesus angulatus]
MPTQRLASSKATESDITHILNIPSEIIFQILYKLHPIDLYHISSTCTGLRACLLELGSDFFKCKRFSRHDEVPKCPKGWHIVRWLEFLFGPLTCETCRRNGAPPDFGILRKLCISCRGQVLVSVSRAEMKNWHHHEGTQIARWMLNKCCRSLRMNMSWNSIGELGEDEADYHGPYYLRDDVELITFLVCDSCKASSLDEWERKNSEYEANRAKVASDIETCNLAYRWSFDIMRDFNRRQSEWYRWKISKECKKLGFSTADIHGAGLAISRHLDAWEAKGLGRREFRYHFTKFIVPLLEAHAKQKRPEVHNETEATRYMRTIPTVQWRYFPSAIYNWGSDYRLKGLNLRKDSPTEINRKLREWRLGVRNDLLKQLPKSDVTANTSSTGASHAGVRKPSLLNLAVSTFSCSLCVASHYKGAALVGWSEVLTHICNFYAKEYESHSDIKWSPAARETALALLALVGLDPLTTAADEMDALDARFFCGNCEVVRTHSRCYRKAFKWRECLTHSVYDVQPGHRRPNWLLLGKEAAAFVKEREEPYPNHNHSLWACALCPRNVEALWRHIDVQVHLNREHLVPNAKTDRYNLYIPNRMSHHYHGGGPWYQSRKPRLYLVEPAWQFKCLLCHSLDKLLKKEDILKHIQKRFV